MPADNPTFARSRAVMDRRYSAGQFISVRINELSDFQACSSCLELKRSSHPKAHPESRRRREDQVAGEIQKGVGSSAGIHKARATVRFHRPAGTRLF